MKTKFNVKGLLKALALIGLLVAAVLMVPRAMAQKKEKGNPDDKNKPNVSINVNKQTDKNGNITRYDSTYSWSWSNQGNVPANMDSMMSKMQEHFFNGNFFKNDPSFQFPFNFNDSSFVAGNFGDMFGKDFGHLDKLWENHRKMMERFFNEEPLPKMPKAEGRPIPQKQKKEEKMDSTFYKNNNYVTPL